MKKRGKLEDKLKSIGKEVFVELYPLVMANLEISVEEIIREIPHYATYKENPQRTRLSSTRTIIKSGFGQQALANIISSKKVSDLARQRASNLLLSAIIQDTLKPHSDFPYEDYHITGDVEEIKRIVHTNGLVNINKEEICSMLSKEGNNYVSVGYANSQENFQIAFQRAANELPIALDATSRFLFAIWIAKDSVHQAEKLTALSDYLAAEFPEQDICWGLFRDTMLDIDKVKITLIAVDTEDN